MRLALGMIACNTFSKKRDTPLITCTSGLTNTQTDYIIVRTKDSKRVKDVKVIVVELRCSATSTRNMWHNDLCSKRSQETTYAKKEGLEIKWRHN